MEQAQRINRAEVLRDVLGYLRELRINLAGMEDSALDDGSAYLAALFAAEGAEVERLIAALKK